MMPPNRVRKINRELVTVGKDLKFSHKITHKLYRSACTSHLRAPYSIPSLFAFDMRIPKTLKLDSRVLRIHVVLVVQSTHSPRCNLEMRNKRVQCSSELEHRKDVRRILLRCDIEFA